MKDFRPCLKALMSSSRAARGGLALITGINLVNVAASLGFVWISKRVVDLATGNVSGEMLPAVLVMAGITLIQIICLVSSNYFVGSTTINTKNRIRSAVFDKTLRSTWLGGEKFHSADISNRLEEDIRVVTDFLCSTLPLAIVTVVQLIAASAMLFILSPQLGWILIWIMPVAVVGSRLFFKTMRRLSTEIRAVDGRIQGHVQENLLHRVLFKTIGTQEGVEEGLDELQKQEKDKTLTRLGYSSVSRAFMHTGFAAGYLVAFIWGAYGIKAGTVSYGLMVAFLQLVSQVQRPVASLASCIPALIRALSSQERLMELGELEQEDAQKDIDLGEAPGIRLTSVDFAYSQRPEKVLSALSFDFKPAQLTVVCGPTGRGKSTLIQLILALLKPDKGTVEIYNDKDSVVSCPGTRCNFQYVPQGNSLLSGSIRSNLLMADPDATDSQLYAALHVSAADFVKDLPEGLDTSCAEIGRGLSEGQAQRIAVARALLHKGGVIILDEATSALDEKTELELLTNITEAKRTVICITHRPAAVKMADAVLNL